MIYTFDALRREVLRQLDEEDDAPTTELLAGDYLNQAHQVRALAYQQYFLLHPREETLTTTPGVQRYTLNPLVNGLLYLRNATENILMREVPNRGLVTGDFDWSTQEGSASEFMFWGHSGVANQPQVASVVKVRSSSTSDTGGNYEVVVKGIDSEGNISAERFVLVGTTEVEGVIAFVEILTVTKSQSFNGTLTITADAGATTVLKLSPLEMGRQYRQIYLVQEPTSAETLRYRFYRKPLVMINDFDVPDIPSPYAQILVWDALLLFAGYNTDIAEKSISVWREQQRHWEEALEQYLRETQTLNAQPLFVQNREDGWSDTIPVMG